MKLNKDTKILIVGLGVIGGGYATALTEGGYTVKCITKNAEDIEYATERGMIAYGTTEVEPELIAEAELIVFALYPTVFIEWVKEHGALIKPGTLITDGSGVKSSVVATVQDMLPKGVEFISAHPMAGREFSGVSHSTINLFEKASMILVPVRASLGAIAWLKEYSLNVGFGTVEITTADKHDEIIAFTSQLAHLVSSAYIKSDRATQYMGFSAGSFRDMTRVAKLSPEMWAQLTIDNADFLVDELDAFVKHLNEYKDALKSQDKEKMKELLADGNERKILSEKLKKVKK